MIEKKSYNDAKIDENWGGNEEDLARGLAVRNSIWVADLNGAFGRDGAKESANDALGLVRASYVAIADVEDDQRVDPRRQTRRGRCKLQHSVLVRRHALLGILLVRLGTETASGVAHS